MNNLRNIVLDFDGTLADTTPLIVATMQATIKELGLKPITDEECRATIGLRLEDVPPLKWPGDLRAAELFAPTYRRIFEVLKRPISVVCFPGVIETLAELNRSGYRMAIASSRNRHSLCEYVEQFHIADYFSMLVGGDDVSEGKPSPVPVLKILDACGWEAAETITVGDAPVDVLMGRAAATLTCAVTYGNGTEAELRQAEPTYMISEFAALIPAVSGVTPEVLNYVEKEIIPRYDGFDKAHRRDHVRMVINQSMRIASHMPGLDMDMVYCIAAFHDTGLVNGRERHHVDSAEILRADRFVREHFSSAQIDTMADAVEDHRASGKSEPRTDYGRVVADADRFIDAETIIRRTVQYGLANYPELDLDGHLQRTIEHLENKYGRSGYLRIWLPWSDNAARLERLRDIIDDRGSLAAIFRRIYNEELLD